MNKADSSQREAGPPPVQAVATRQEAGALKPKGACWYCNAPLDNIRRFCNKTCAEDYKTEEETFKPASP